MGALSCVTSTRSHQLLRGEEVRWPELIFNLPLGRLSQPPLVGFNFLNSYLSQQCPFSHFSSRSWRTWLLHNVPSDSFTIYLFVSFSSAQPSWGMVWICYKPDRNCLGYSVILIKCRICKRHDLRPRFKNDPNKVEAGVTFPKSLVLEMNFLMIIVQACGHLLLFFLVSSIPKQASFSKPNYGQI